MADRLGRLLDPYQAAPSFVGFPSSDAPALAPLPLTHHWQRVHFLVWCNLPGETSTVPFLNAAKLLILLCQRTVAIDAHIDQLKHVIMIQKVT
jgi:hypothetical protein